MTVGDGERYLTEDEVATMLRVSPHTLRNWRSRGGGPEFVKVGGRLVRYAESEVHAYMKARGMGITRRPVV